MTVKLNKELIQACDTVYQKNSRITVETDVNVPDINPDILKVLDVSGYAAVSEKSLSGGKICINGTVVMTVLYAPDGDVMSKVKTLSATKDFTYNADVPQKDDNLRLCVEIEPESFAYTLINSRKMSLRCVLGTDTKLCRTIEFEIPVSCDEESALCTQTRSLRLCSNEIYCENRIKLNEKHEISSDKPPVAEILKTIVFPQSDEFTMLDGKAAVKGQVRICTLYTSDEDGEVCCDEYTLPFDEIIDADGAEEDMEGEIDYCVSDMFCEICDDSDGEPRIIGIELGLGTVIRGHKIFEPSVISDAYSLNGETKIVSEKRSIEQLVDNTTAQFTQKIEVAVPEGMPDISALCDAAVSAAVDNIRVGNGEITVNGTLNSNILYLSDDAERPVGAFSDKTEFAHTLSAPGVSGGSVCDAKIFAEHVSYTMNGNRSIDLRVVLGMCIRSFNDEEIPIITDIEVSEDSTAEIQPCIIIYFVKSGDTLWNIAKRYHTTVDDIKENNNMTSDSIFPGQQIRILR